MHETNLKEMKQMKHLIGYFSLLALMLTSCGKTVLETPGDGGVDPTLVHAELTLTVDPSLIPYTPTKNEGQSEDPYDTRWIIEVFRDAVEGTPVERQILTCDPASDGKHSITTSFDLHAAQYYVVAWMDYVDNGSTDDKYYQVNSLASIGILDADAYLGNEEHKDTYVGQQSLDLTAYRDRWDETVTSTMTLERPMAKIEIITNDVDKLLTRLAANRLELSGVLSDNLLSANPDLSALQVTIDYAGYFPSSFNAYTNKPNDATQGVSFTGSATQLSDKEARLGSDYIFVNGSESAVTINLTIRDDEGNLINRAEGINVPIVRGQLTTIRDEYLTKAFAPGIGIDTGFDGSFDIVIPD